MVADCLYAGQICASTFTMPIHTFLWKVMKALRPQARSRSSCRNASHRKGSTSLVVRTNSLLGPIPSASLSWSSPDRTTQMYSTTLC